jgi:glycine oxidase
VTSPLDVIVIGGGVLGLASAAELTARGLSVAVVDPGGPNASGVAAGMIAPAMESAQEDAPPDVVDVLKAARALWPEFAARHGLDLIEDGSEWQGEGAEELQTRLQALGFAVERTATGLLAPDDARIDPGKAMRTLAAACRTIGSSVFKVMHEDGLWTATLGDGRRLAGSHLVLATGAASAVEGLPGAVARLVGSVVPVRGQIAASSGPAPGRSIRTPFGYVVPTQEGVLYGASMEPGRRDLEPDPASAVAQAQAVAAIAGTEVDVVDVRVGVRGALPDGLPAVGRLDDLLVALAPRRNGWLLAPLVARVVADAVQGRPPVAQAAALDPSRPGLSPEG